jgi:hypothetical protein
MEKPMEGEMEIGRSLAQGLLDPFDLRRAQSINGAQFLDAAHDRTTFPEEGALLHSVIDRDHLFRIEQEHILQSLQ